MLRTMKSLAAAALLAGVAVSPSLAQQQEGLVNVMVTDIELLRTVGIQVPVDVEVSQVQVQVPIGIAAQVCGVSANVIAQQGQQAVDECEVTQAQTTQAFNNQLRRNQSQIEQQLVGG